MQRRRVRRESVRIRCLNGWKPDRVLISRAQDTVSGSFDAWTVESSEPICSAICPSLRALDVLCDTLSHSEDYDYSNPGFSETTGHFTQVVWVSTTALGCAMVDCSTSKVGSFRGTVSILRSSVFYILLLHQLLDRQFDADSQFMICQSHLLNARHPLFRYVCQNLTDRRLFPSR